MDENQISQRTRVARVSVRKDHDLCQQCARGGQSLAAGPRIGTATHEAQEEIAMEQHILSVEEENDFARRRAA